jgi:hypothetical protein
MLQVVTEDDYCPYCKELLYMAEAVDNFKQVKYKCYGCTHTELRSIYARGMSKSKKLT